MVKVDSTLTLDARAACSWYANGLKWFRVSKVHLYSKNEANFLEFSCNQLAKISRLFC